METVYEQKVVKTPQMPQQQNLLAQFKLFFWIKNSRGLNEEMVLGPLCVRILILESAIVVSEIIKILTP